MTRALSTSLANKRTLRSTRRRHDRSARDGGRRRWKFASAVAFEIADDRARRARGRGDRSARDGGRRRWKIASAVAFEIADQGAGANGDVVLGGGGSIVGVGALDCGFVDLLW